MNVFNPATYWPVATLQLITSSAGCSNSLDVVLFQAAIIPRDSPYKSNLIENAPNSKR